MLTQITAEADLFKILIYLSSMQDIKDKFKLKKAKQKLINKHIKI